MQVVTQAEVLSIIDLTENIKEFVLKPEKYRRFEPGAFLQLSLDIISASDYWPDSRTFSIACNYNKEKTIKLIIKKVGNYTSRIFNELIIGSTLTLKYSFSDMFLPEDDNKSNIVCIAGGTGIVPFFSFIEYLKEEDQIDRMKLYYSAKNEEEFLNFDFIKDELNKNVKFYCTQSETDLAINGRIKISDISNYSKQDNFYICGSAEFIDYFSYKLSELGFENIHFDKWE